MKPLAIVAAFLAACALSLSAAQNVLSIYFIDVEGGQSTLLVSPSGETLLIDAGFPSDGTFTSTPGDPAKARDAQRILAAMRDAGVKQIDNFFLTHFHADHDGGVPELAQLTTIRRVFDHARPADDAEKGVQGTTAAFEAYLRAVAHAAHVQPRPATRLPIAGVDAIVVSAAGTSISTPLSGGGAPNGGCTAPRVPAEEATENPRSNGLRVRFGAFTFLDVGDLTGAPLYALFCPNDLVGAVDVYLLPHHGGADARDRAVFGAIPPRVAIVNNGATKGGAPETLAAAHDAAPVMDVWQLHRSQNNGARNYPDGRIANLDESTAFWIKVTARADGSFDVVNGRTGEVRPYPRR